MKLIRIAHDSGYHSRIRERSVSGRDPSSPSRDPGSELTSEEQNGPTRLELYFALKADWKLDIVASEPLSSYPGSQCHSRAHHQLESMCPLFPVQWVVKDLADGYSSGPQFMRICSSLRS